MCDPKDCKRKYICVKHEIYYKKLVEKALE